jgi:hypothetical protein
MESHLLLPESRKFAERHGQESLRISIYLPFCVTLSGEASQSGLRAHAGSHRVAISDPGARAQRVTTFSHTIVCRSP